MKAEKITIILLACLFFFLTNQVHANTTPDFSKYDCGTRSLAYLLEKDGAVSKAEQVGSILPNSAKGHSVFDLLAIAEEKNEPVQARLLNFDELTRLRLPVIVLLKGKRTGHYTILERITPERLFFYDSRDKRRFSYDSDSFTAKWSRVTLVHGTSAFLPGQELTAAQMHSYYGGDNEGPPVIPLGGGNNGAPECPPGESCNKCNKGAPVWTVNQVNFNIYVSDNPLWYTPARGPEVNAQISYNTRADINGDELFGNKWIFHYRSYLEVALNGNVTVTMPDGRRDVFIPDGSGGYNQPYNAYNELVKLSSNHFELRFQSGTTYVYQAPIDSKTYLTQVWDAYGQSLSLTYDGTDQLTAITDALGQVTTLTYNGVGLVEEISDPFGRTAQFVYDANRNLIQVTDMGGLATDLEYDSDSYLSALVNDAGRTEFYIEPADNAGVSLPYPPPGVAMRQSYRITVTYPDSGKEEFFYSGAFGYSWHVRPKDYIEYSSYHNNYSWDVPKTIYYYTNTVKGVREEISSVNHPNGERQLFTYDYNTGNLLTISDALGSMVAYTYNDKGRITSVTVPSGRVTQYTYAVNDIDLIKVEDGLGNTQLTYNNYHDVTSVTSHLGKITGYTYNPYGQLISITDPLNIETILTYDANHLLSQVTRDTQVVTDVTFDPKGRLKTLQDTTGMLVSYGYDNLNHLTSITYPDGKAIVAEYGSSCCVGLVTKITDRAGGMYQYEYNAAKKLVRSVNPEGGVSRFKYDLNGNLIQFIDPNANVTAFEYGIGNRLTKRIYADGAGVAYSYGDDGRISQIINSRGLTTWYYYDENKNLLTVDYQDSATPDVYVDYDMYDRVTQIEDGSGMYAMTYDAGSRPVTFDGPLDNDLITYSYDDLSRMVGLTQQGGRGLAYLYDNLNRLTHVQVAGADYEYGYPDTKNPLVQSLSRPNGSVTTYQYDQLNRLQGIINKNSAQSVISSYIYTYNNQDLRDSETITGELPPITLQEGMTQYTYNAVNQLLSTTNPGQSFIYDTDGNMTRGYTPEGYVFIAACDGENRLDSLEYTDNGGVVHKTTYTYRWDGFVAGIKKYEDSTLVDDARIVRGSYLALQERDSSNATTREYAWGLNFGGGIGGLLNLRQNASDLYYLFDGKGNVSSLLDSTQTQVAQYKYDAFGRLMQRSGTVDQPFRFSTKRYDAATGLSYYGFRFYAPAIERWMNRDPLGEAGGINLYGFVGNDPVNFVDPDGLFAATTVAIVRFVVIPLAVRYGPVAYQYGREAAYKYGPYIPMAADAALGFFDETGPPNGLGYATSAAKMIYDNTVDKDVKTLPCHGNGW